MGKCRQDFHSSFTDYHSDMPDEWPWRPKTTVLRREVHALFGGQQQGGISTPTSISDVLVFTDPDAGHRFGYDKFEGLRSDGGYSYTGEGQRGRKTFVRGNRGILQTADLGSLIRLFRTRGTSATYVGAFTLGDPRSNFSRSLMLLVCSAKGLFSISFRLMRKLRFFPHMAARR